MVGRAVKRRQEGFRERGRRRVAAQLSGPAGEQSRLRFGAELRARCEQEAAAHATDTLVGRRVGALCVALWHLRPVELRIHRLGLDV